jgi:hypothetical protein
LSANEFVGIGNGLPTLSVGTASTSGETFGYSFANGVMSSVKMKPTPITQVETFQQRAVWSQLRDRNPHPVRCSARAPGSLAARKAAQITRRLLNATCRTTTNVE